MHINIDAFLVPECVSVQATLTVPKEISALELIPTENGTRLGPIVSIPQGARLETCGFGFNRRTLKARYEGRFYFVFLQDLELLEAMGPATTAGAAPMQALGNQHHAARL